MCVDISTLTLAPWVYNCKVASWLNSICIMGTLLSKWNKEDEATYKTPRSAGNRSSGAVTPKALDNETPKEFVERYSGAFYTDPFVDNLAGWSSSMHSSDPFPRTGSFSRFHINMIRGLCLGDTEAFPWYSGDAEWDMKYMGKCAKTWIQLAPYYKQSFNNDGGNKALAATTEGDEEIPRNNLRKQAKLIDGANKRKLTQMDDGYYGECSNEELRKMGKQRKLKLGSYLTRQQLITQLRQDDGLQEPGTRTCECRECIIPRPPMEPSTSSQIIEPSVKKTVDLEDIKGKTRAHTEKLKQEEMIKLEQKDTDISPNGQGPFKTVGEQITIEPLDPGTFNSIISGCPSPLKNPQAAVNYLRATTKGLNYTGEDYKLLIHGVMGYEDELEFDWKDIPHLSDLNKEHSTGTTYPFGIQEEIRRMWDKVLELWLRRQSDQIDLIPVLACKQNSEEEVSVFLKRFKKAWTEEGGLGRSDGFALVYVQLLMDAFRPEVARTIKQMSDTWYKQTPKALDELIMIKDVAGCFDDGKPVRQEYQQRVSRDNRDRNQRKFPRRGGIDKQRNNRCFACRQTGHWKQDCPNIRQKYMPDPQQDIRQTFSRAVHYSIDWQNPRMTQYDSLEENSLTSEFTQLSSTLPLDHWALKAGVHP